MRAIPGSGAEAVKQGAEAILFVEGKNKDGLDQGVIDELMRGVVRVEPLGANFQVSGVAQALHATHPHYLFLLDRDHHRDEDVERSWAGFPDPAQHNVLIWRRKELENYLIDPSWVCASGWVRKPEGELRAWLLSSFQRELWAGCAHLVLAQLREKFKVNWVQTRDLASPLTSQDEVLRALCECPQIMDRPKKASEWCSPETLRQELDQVVTRVVGVGSTDGQLRWGQGRWLELLPGKAVYSQLVNLFVPRERFPKDLQAKDRELHFARYLVQSHVDAAPQDVRELREKVRGALGR